MKSAMKKTLSIIMVIVVINIVIYSIQARGCPYLKKMTKTQGMEGTVLLNRPHGPKGNSEGGHKRRTAEDPFIEANDLFLKNYQNAKHTSITGKLTYPVIMANGGNLRLLLNGTLSGQTISEEMIGDLFTALKVVAHTPLNIFAILYPYVVESLPHQKVQLQEETINALRDAQDAFQSVLGAIDTKKWTSDVQRNRQVAMLTRVIQFTSDLIANPLFSYDQLTALTKDMEEDIVKNINYSGKVQIERIDAIVSEWKNKYLVDTWDQVRVLIGGSHFASRDNLVHQYFMYKLGLEHPGSRIVQAGESLTDEQLFYTLSVALVDTQVGGTFFQDYSFMHSDVLRSAANAWVTFQKTFADIQEG